MTALVADVPQDTRFTEVQAPQSDSQLSLASICGERTPGFSEKTGVSGMDFRSLFGDNSGLKDLDYKGLTAPGQRTELDKGVLAAVAAKDGVPGLMVTAKDSQASAATFDAVINAAHSGSGTERHPFIVSDPTVAKAQDTSPSSASQDAAMNYLLTAAISGKGMRQLYGNA